MDLPTALHAGPFIAHRQPTSRAFFGEAPLRTCILSIFVLAFMWWGACESAAASLDYSQLSRPSIVSDAQLTTTSTVGVAFDQIDRTIQGSATPPPMNHFDADVAAIQRYQSASFGMSGGNMATMMAENIAAQIISAINPIASLITSAAQQAQANAMRKRQEEQMEAMTGPDPGTLTHYAFYHGWARAEVSGIVVIIKPDQHQEIILDTPKKTYRTQTLTPLATAAPAVSATTESNPAQATVTVATTQSDDATVNGQAASGYKSDATVALSNSEDPCKDGNFTASQIEYFTNLTEPTTTAAAASRLFYSLALPQYCNVALQPTWAGPALPNDRMYIYRLVKVVRDPALAAKPPPTDAEIKQQNMMRKMFGSTLGPDPNYTLLSERSNIRQLTESDASLFEVPAGYAETP